MFCVADRLIDIDELVACTRLPLDNQKKERESITSFSHLLDCEIIVCLFEYFLLPLSTIFLGKDAKKNSKKYLKQLYPNNQKRAD